jgi:hypothetical protein
MEIPSTVPFLIVTVGPLDDDDDDPPPLFRFESESEAVSSSRVGLAKVSEAVVERARRTCESDSSILDVSLDLQKVLSAGAYVEKRRKGEP